MEADLASPEEAGHLTTAHVYPAYELRDEQGHAVFRVDVVVRVGPTRRQTLKLGEESAR